MGILRRLKILVSAVQFRPGTPQNSTFTGENADSGPSRFSDASTVSTGTGTPAVQPPGPRTRTQLTRREAEESGRFYAIGREDGPRFVAGVRLSDPVLDARRESGHSDRGGVTGAAVELALAGGRPYPQTSAS